MEQHDCAATLDRYIKKKLLNFFKFVQEQGSSMLMTRQQIRLSIQVAQYDESLTWESPQSSATY